MQLHQTCTPQQQQKQQKQNPKKRHKQNPYRQEKDNILDFTIVINNN